MKAVKETLKCWTELERYIQVPTNKSSYLLQLDLLQELLSLPLKQRNSHVNNLIDLLVENIQIYEAPRISKNTATAIDVLLSLMEEHELTQSDLPEIGSQSLVSKIIKGERKLTATHIKKLSKRFHVSPSVFFD
jgi:HTH-type transcriptional regulator / antitoxin HigA